MPDYLTTRELADMLRIKERRVYDLVATEQIPYSKATGKLLFAKDEIDAWIARTSVKGGMRPGQQLTPPPAVFLGSHDPLLDWALRESQCGIATLFDGSTDGLERFVTGAGIATGLHVYDEPSGSWNVPLVTRQCSGMPVVLFEWAKRSRGLIVSKAAESSYQSLHDLFGCRVVARQQGAGSQQKFQQLLSEASIDYSKLDVVSVARTEVDATLAVLEGQADVAFGLQSLAEQYQLGFVPLIVEHFDLLMHRRTWFEPQVQVFLEFCKQQSFLERVATMQGYDCSALGAIKYNGP